MSIHIDAIVFGFDLVRFYEELMCRNLDDLDFASCKTTTLKN